MRCTSLMPNARRNRTKSAKALRALPVERARRDRAIVLHVYFLSPDFYSKVIAPAFHARLAWMQLTKDPLGAYRDAVVGWWRGNLNECTLNRYVPRSLRKIGIGCCTLLLFDG